MTDIGATLREARMRARIDVSEIEAQTKIRAKYLRALENEEWDLLPGPTFVRSFLRTYAQALGLDDKALVDEYRLRYEAPSELEHQPIVASPRQTVRRAATGVGGPSRAYAIAVGTICLLIVLLLVGLLSGKGGGSAKKIGGSSSATTAQAHARGASTVTSKSSTTAVVGARVSLSLRPSAPVYVCLIGDGGRKLIPGTIIQPPYTPVTYRAKRFEITLGNNAVTMYVDGKPRTVPASAKAIGYTITSSGRHALAASSQPTCK
jgi:cytoskeletal protein RodZ